MHASTDRRRERGATIIEVLIAMFIVTVAMLGFATVLIEAANSSARAHRRTAATLVRASASEQATMLSRDNLASVEAAAPATWIITACYDSDGTLAASNPLPFNVAFACPNAGTYYRTWINVARVPSMIVNPLVPRAFSISTFGERFRDGNNDGLHDEEPGCGGPARMFANPRCPLHWSMNNTIVTD